MITAQKIRIESAISRIQTATDIDPWAAEIAVESMRKQIPQKPKKSKEPRYGMGYTYYDWICPTCGKKIAFEPAVDKKHHCICGQAIDWEEHERLE
jgi:hypothetical protein